MLTAGGRGMLTLAASDTAERGLTVTAFVPDFVRFPADAPERGDAPLVALAQRTGIPVHVLGRPARQPTVRRMLSPEASVPTRGLPD